MSGLFGSTTIKGTRLTDFSGALVSVGDPIAFGYGEFVVEGHVIFAPLPPKEHYSKKRQGKGGVKQEVYTYTLSYGVAFAAGPIYGFKWIKRNGKVVYTTDPNAPIEDRQYAAKWAGRVQFYWGTADQMPDSIMESYKGTGNVSAHRFLCFIVLEDEDVTEGGGAPATYEACVIATPPEAYLTSLPYPQMLTENVEMDLAVTGGNLVQVLYESDMEDTNTEMSMSMDDGDMYDPPPALMEGENTEMGLLPTGGQLILPPPADMQDTYVEMGIVPTNGNMSIPPVGTLGKDETEMGLVPTGGELFTQNGHMYWRLRITANDGHASQSGFTEIELRTSLGGPDITATGSSTGAVTASSQVNSSNRPALAVDNSLSTGWLASTTTGSWVYNCGHADHLGNLLEDVVQIAIRGSWNQPTASPRDFVLEYSDNNSTWTVAMTVTGQTGWTGASDIRVFNV